MALSTTIIYTAGRLAASFAEEDNGDSKEARGNFFEDAYHFVCRDLCDNVVYRTTNFLKNYNQYQATLERFDRSKNSICLEILSGQILLLQPQS